MSGNSSSLSLKDEDVTKFLASATHIGATNLDFQMEQYVFKRRADAEGEPSQRSKKKAVDCRRSTAAQFFVEEETVQQTVTADRVVQLLTTAMHLKEEDAALKNLQVVQDLVIHKEPKLLDNFLDEVVSFQHDPKPKVRKFVVEFIEEACKKDPQILPKVIGNLNLMLGDQNVNVQKKVIQTTTQLYPVTIRWLCNARNVDEVMEATWNSMSQLKNRILLLLDSDNEGVRVLAVKFMEGVVIAQTFKDQYTDPKSGDLSLDEIPFILKIFRPRKLEDEAKEVFSKIINFHGASHISSVNLMACMQVLTTIAKKRFEFFPKVLQAFESLHVNLPPTLSQSQVSSVRKNLKLHLFTLVKHPGAVEFHSRISIMLSDLGATSQQIAKCIPNIDISKKRSVAKEEVWSKRAKTEEETVKPESSRSKTTDRQKTKESAIDITAEDLVPKFNVTNVADLVLVSMLNLPDGMPPHFQSTYTPIAAAGTEPQIRHLARLLATQLTLYGLGKGLEVRTEGDLEKMEGSDEEDDVGTKQIQTLVGRVTDQKPKKQALVLMPSGSQAKQSRSKKLDMQTTIKPLNDEEADKLCRCAFNRILDAEKYIAKRGAGAVRTKILTTLATQFRGDMANDLKNHVLENPRGRLELAFSWLYQEYASYRGFEGSAEGPIEKYEQVVNDLLCGVLENDEQNHILFGRFFLDAPYITDGMAESLKVICTDENATSQALQIAKNMTIRRPPKKLLFLGVICELSLHENVEVRDKAVNTAVELHETGHLQSFIENFALRSLKFLRKPTPPSKDFPLFNQPPLQWSEDLTKVCLHLYLALLPINHRLIHDLGTVYVETSADIKRTILRALEVPVKGMSMSSPELLRFVENCPKGAETLVTRIIHILTDKAPPSNELVDRVRDLYHKRVPDVRFLIPIINGLSKREVIAALPELIKLNPTVVKEVFHRLLGSSFQSPLSPAELLVALHNIDPAKCNLKIIIKATALCFEEKNVYTQVVLAMVMQQLMEQDPLPILLMRTVIQSLANYPHLLGFVTNILQRLITKKVWTQKKIWEGFIKCCQRTKPQSFQVLLQLPAPQLEEVLNSCPDLRDPLCQYVDNFTEHQKEHISSAIIDVLNIFKPKTVPDSVEKESENTGEPLPPGQEEI